METIYDVARGESRMFPTKKFRLAGFQGTVRSEYFLPHFCGTNPLPPALSPITQSITASSKTGGWEKIRVREVGGQKNTRIVKKTELASGRKLAETLLYLAH
jgi:hypothetical protein